MENTVRKIVPEFGKRPVNVQFLTARRTECARHGRSTVQARAAAMARIGPLCFTCFWFDGTGQQPTRYNVAHCLDLTRHDAIIAAGAALVIAFAFWRSLC